MILSPERHATTPDLALLLATDLDGTFLAGHMNMRKQLYRMVEAHPEINLAWVTGRGLEAVLPLLSDPALPNPDYVICDVGATVLRVSTMQPMQPLQADIEARWPGEQAVVAAMSRFTGLVRQDVPQQRRCSYYCDPELLHALRAEIEQEADQLGCEVLYSVDRYLDILPRKTDKGSTLSALIAHLGIDQQRVLVAGDTMNDLSMYEAGFPGVCVGESEPALLQATSGRTNVLHADKAGCGGILEAIRHFDLLDPKQIRRYTPAIRESGKAELVMVYHRLPYEEVLVDGQRVRRSHSSPNGIIPSLLSFFGDGHPGSWVAWSVQDRKNAAFEVHTEVDAERYPHLLAARVPLSKPEVDVFYKRFSKEAFWPVINTFWERARFNEDDWQVFKQINRRFAEATAAEAAPGAVVWLHDYNLWMVPSTLRELRPDLKIAFFHHTHFPAGDIFNIIPWRREILGSLLACDYIGFHIPRHVENFVDTVRSSIPIKVVSRTSCAPRFLTFGCAVGVETMVSELQLGERRVRLGAHPIGTEVGRIRECLESPQVLENIANIRAEIGDRKLVLSIERLDYGKGILEKLLAFENLLEQESDLHGNVTLLMVCVPAAKEMTIYRSLQTQIDQAVGRINGRFSRLEWTPVRFFARALPFEEVVAHYAAADVMWITPLRDGLNLVAKEFIAAQGVHGGNGVLVLSEFAGAAAELKGALLTNPHDPVDLVNTLKLALSMTVEEREGRQRGLFEIVSHYDLARWGRDFLEAVRNDSPATT
ncbi:MAG: glucosylglycerol-phosphate synthase [Burkholderiales bacterium]|nr:glucosylglycerol-phosphate synthase [Burkholderiales bacterium]